MTKTSATITLAEALALAPFYEREAPGTTAEAWAANGWPEAVPLATFVAWLEQEQGTAAAAWLLWRAAPRPVLDAGIRGVLQRLLEAGWSCGGCVKRALKLYERRARGDEPRVREWQDATVEARRRRQSRALPSMPLRPARVAWFAAGCGWWVGDDVSSVGVESVLAWGRDGHEEERRQVADLMAALQEHEQAPVGAG